MESWAQQVILQQGPLDGETVARVVREKSSLGAHLVFVAPLRDLLDETFVLV